MEAIVEAAKVSAIVRDLFAKQAISFPELEFNPSRCLFQKRARKKLLARLEKTRETSNLYLDDVVFEINVLKCKDCKVTIYRDGSWIDELCDKHSKESKQL